MAEHLPGFAPQRIYQRRSYLIRIVQGSVRKRLMKICAVRFALFVRKTVPTSVINFSEMGLVLCIYYLNRAPVPNNEVRPKVTQRPYELDRTSRAGTPSRQGVQP
jgi:hypothetical protein